ncbi:MAG: hypothetical protein IKI84_09585 [Clostridia bacterium]|nr:hypothetical protein [Clostridia bacterium]
MKCFKQYKQSMIASRPDVLDHIRMLVKKGVSDARYFVWPQEIVSSGRVHGYIMDLVDSSYAMLVRFVLPMSLKGVRFCNTKVTVDAMLNLVSAFNVLHMTGYSYQDLSLGNFMFNPETGDLRIIDNDNISINNTGSGILGTPGFIAPEVLSSRVPNRYSDYFSLSIILFHIFFRAHPLEGVRALVPLLTPEKEMAMYCSDPVFIFDREDARNRPDRDLQGYVIRVWNQMPAYLQGAFQVALGKEAMLREPRKRIDESSWEKILIRLRNDVVSCPWCDAEMAYIGRPLTICPDCRKPLGTQYAFRTDHYKYPIPISYNCALMSGNLRYCDTGRGNIREIEIKRAKNDHRILIIKNVSGKRITVRRADAQNDVLAENAMIAVTAVKQIVMSDGTVISVGPLQ